MSANGGPGNGLGGGGGGGRIAIFGYTNYAFSGTMTAYGGAGSNWGGAGTIYRNAAGPVLGSILVDNGGHISTGTNTVITPAQINPANFGNGDLTIVNGGLVYLSAGSLTFLSNLVVGANGTLTTPQGQTNLDLVVLGNLNVQTGGVIAVDGLGFPANFGPGSGTSSNYIGSGAGYGGRGGASSMSPGGPTYGSTLHPVDQGSGGGQGYPSGSGGSEGGGAIRLQVGGTLNIDGRLSANGHDGLQDDSGGGSGGSIWATAYSLTGAGLIRANGGAGELYEGGGGGGGRIAIYSPFEDFNGEISAFGGSGYSVGRSGSIFIGSDLDVPAVVSQNPSGFVSNSVASVDLAFNTALNPASLIGNTSVRLTAPTGAVAQAFLSPYQPNPETIRIYFNTQTAEGTYTLTIGPQLQNIYGQSITQAYTGSFTISYPVIRGIVTDINGVPVPGVVFQTSLGAKATNDSYGNYALEVAARNYAPPLALAPSKSGLVFVPSFRAYTNITTSISNQNYLAVTTAAPMVSSHLSSSNFSFTWFGLPGVTYQVYYSTDLANWLPFGAVVVGTNGPSLMLLPTGPERAKFFRVQAMY
jgi:hypothetical protein